MSPRITLDSTNEQVMSEFELDFGIDLEDLDREDLRLLLSEQMETYRSAQSHAQSLFRTLIASIAVIVAFSSTDGVNKLILNLTESETATLLLGGQTIQTIQTREQLIDAGFQIGGGMAILGFSFVAAAIAFAMQVQKSDSPRPFAPSVKGAVGEIPNETNSKVSEWVKQNNLLLSEISRYNRHSYVNLYWGASALLLSTVLILSASMGVPAMIIVASVFVYAIGPLAVLVPLIEASKSAYSVARTPAKEIPEYDERLGRFPRVQRVIAVLFQGGKTFIWQIHHRGPGMNPFIVAIILYGAPWSDAGTLFWQVFIPILSGV